MENTGTEAKKADPMRMQYRQLSQEEQKVMAHYKNVFDGVWNMLDAAGPSRELSIAKTKLEEACMWAVKHLTA